MENAVFTVIHKLGFVFRLHVQHVVAKLAELHLSLAILNVFILISSHLFSHVDIMDPARINQIVNDALAVPKQNRGKELEEIKNNYPFLYNILMTMISEVVCR